MTRLEAINRMLGSLMLPSVPSLDVDGLPPEVGTAEALLDQSNQQVQQRGWWFNTKIQELEPVNSRVALGTDVLSVRGIGRRDRLGKVGDYLYDFREETFDIDDKVTVELVKLIRFSKLDPVAQNAVLFQALADFQGQMYGQQGINQLVLSQAQGAYRELITEHNRVKRPNMYDSSYYRHAARRG